MNEFNQYLKIRLAAGISERTLEDEHYIHKKMWKFIGHDNLNLYKPEDIESFIRHLQDSDYSKNSINGWVKKLRPYFTEAVIQGWALNNPMLNIKTPRRIKVLPNILSVQQMKKMLATPDIGYERGLRDRAMMELMYSSGLRVSEVIKVHENMFNDDFRTIRLIGKGNKEAVIPVGRMAAYFCKHCVKYFKTGYVFPSFNTKTLMVKSSINKLINGYAKLAGIEVKVTPHTFRYSVATHLSDHGADIRHIQEFMRHESLDTTADYIRHGIQKLREVHKSTHPRG